MPHPLSSLRAWCLALALALGGAQALAVTPEQFAAMEPEAALRLPVLDTLQVFGWNKRELLFVLENGLIDLRYLYRVPSGMPSKQLTAAIKAFQREIGAKPTGVLLVGQFMDLIQRSNEFWQVPIYPGPAFVTSSGDVVLAEGTWSSGGTRERDPIQSTSIRCYRAAGICSSVTARVLMAEEGNHWFHASSADLALSARDWKITESSADKLVAEDTTRPCVAYTLTLELKTQAGTMQTRPVPGDKCDGAAEPARSYRLSNGFELAARYWDERQARLLKLRSAAFQKMVQLLRK